MPSSSNNEGFVLGGLPVDASFPRPRSLVWLLSRALMGEGTHSWIQGAVPVAGANSTSQAGADTSVWVLGYRQPDYLVYPAICSQCPGSHQALIAHARSLGARERKQSWRGWVGDGRGNGWRISPCGAKGCCGYCFSELQFTKEIKMPKPCLYAHLGTHGFLSCLMSVRNLRKAERRAGA